MKAQTSSRTPKLDWSDVPFVLAVCEAGSLAGAARLLGVNHSTVFRRVEAVEAKLGVRLFERLSHGYVMTPAGEFFFQKGHSLSEGINRIEATLAGQDLRLEGRLTVTTTDSLLHALTPVFASFQEQHPDVELRVLADAQSLDLMQRDADIALRPTQRPPEHWVGRKLLPIHSAIYAHHKYWKSVDSQSEPNHRWIVLDDDLNRSPMSQLAHANKAPGSPVTVVSTVMGVFDMVQSGIGIAALPCYLGESSPHLTRIDNPDDSITWDLWLLAHPDVRRSARVHAFFDFASTEITLETLGLSGKFR